MLRKFLVFVVVLGLILGTTAFPVSADTQEGFRYSRALFEEVRELVEQNHINPPDEEKSYEKALKGYLEGIGDPYTVFFTPEEYKKFIDDIETAYEGIGIAIGKSGEHTVVIAPIKNTPAERAGMLSGDIIIEVDGQDIEGMPLDYAVHLLRGKEGTWVELKVLRGNQTLTFRVQRAYIEIPSVEYKRLGPIGYIKITTFSEHLPEDFKYALEALMDEELKGLILDVRDNPGGLLSSVFNICEYFISGTVMRMVFRNGLQLPIGTSGSAEFSTVPDELPVVLLVNRGTGSASEILASALKYHKRAVLVGTNTFGKGSVQSVANLKNGGFLKLTTAYYYTPDGKKIDGVGILPDIVVDDPQEQMERAVDILRKAFGREISFRPGQKTAEWADLSITLPSVPVYKDGRYFIPLRPVVECFGTGIHWSEETKSVKYTWLKREYELFYGEDAFKVDSLPYAAEGGIMWSEGAVMVSDIFLKNYMGIETLIEEDKIIIRH
jgi:carboxyl-terminal processing protease